MIVKKKKVKILTPKKVQLRLMAAYHDLEIIHKHLERMNSQEKIDGKDIYEAVEKELYKENRDERKFNRELTKFLSKLEKHINQIKEDAKKKDEKNTKELDANFRRHLTIVRTYKDKLVQHLSAYGTLSGEIKSGVFEDIVTEIRNDGQVQQNMYLAIKELWDAANNILLEENKTQEQSNSEDDARREIQQEKNPWFFYDKEGKPIKKLDIFSLNISTISTILNRQSIYLFDTNAIIDNPPRDTPKLNLKAINKIKEKPNYYILGSCVSEAYSLLNDKNKDDCKKFYESVSTFGYGKIIQLYDNRLGFTPEEFKGQPNFKNSLDVIKAIIGSISDFSDDKIKNFYDGVIEEYIAIKDLSLANLKESALRNAQFKYFMVLALNFARGIKKGENKLNSSENIIYDCYIIAYALTLARISIDLKKNNDIVIFSDDGDLNGILHMLRHNEEFKFEKSKKSLIETDFVTKINLENVIPKLKTEYNQF